MTLANNRDRKFRNSTLIARRTWPSTSAGHIIEEQWQEVSPAVLDPETLEEVTPAVWEMVETRNSPLSAEELERWNEAEAEEESRAKRREVKGQTFIDALEAISSADPRGLTNLQVVRAVQRIAKVTSLLVEDALKDE